MEAGFGIVEDASSKQVVVMNFSEGDIQLAIAVANEDNYQGNIDNMIKGLTDIKAAMRRAKSGLTLVKEVPDALRNTQGRKQHGTRSPRTPGPR